MATTVEVYPKKGETYPDADGVPITAVGANVAQSKYIADALRDGFLLTWDPLEINEPEDRTTLAPDAPADAAYIVASANATLMNELVLTQGANITLTPGPGTMTIASAGNPNAVSGPVSSTPNAVMLFGDGTGKTAKNSLVTVDGSGNITTPGLVDGVDVSGLNTSVSNKADKTTTITAGAGLTGGGDLSAGRTFNVGANADGSIVVGADDVKVGVLATDAQHGTRGGGTLHAPATSLAAGFMSTAQVNALTQAQADIDALELPSYVALAASGTLANERVLTQGSGISITDGGPGNAVTISATGGAAAPLSTPYVTLSADATLPNERVLTAGLGMVLADGGAGGALTLNQTGPTTGFATITTSTTLDTTYIGKMIQVSAGADITVTVPSGLASSSSFWFIRAGSGQVTIALTSESFYFPGGLAAASLQIDLQYGVVLICKWSAALWAATGSIRNGIDSAQYLTLAASPALANERVLTAGMGVTFTDAGAGGALTVAQTGPVTGITSFSASGSVDASYSGKVIQVSTATNATITIPAGLADNTSFWFLRGNTGTVTITLSGAEVFYYPGASAVASISIDRRFGTVMIAKWSASLWTVIGDVQGGDGSSSFVTIGNNALNNERVLTQGPGISITDGGAGGAVTIGVAHPYKASGNASVATQGIPASTWTAVTAWATDVFDPNNNFVAGQYTVPASGFYYVRGMVEFNTITSTTAFVRGRIVRSGTEVLRGKASSGSPTYAGSECSGIISATIGQVITLEAYQSDTLARTLYDGYFSIHFLST